MYYAIGLLILIKRLTYISVVLIIKIYRFISLLSIIKSPLNYLLFFLKKSLTRRVILIEVPLRAIDLTKKIIIIRIIRIIRIIGVTRELFIFLEIKIRARIRIKIKIKSNLTAF